MAQIMSFWSTWARAKSAVLLGAIGLAALVVVGCGGSGLSDADVQATVEANVATAVALALATPTPTVTPIPPTATAIPRGFPGSRLFRDSEGRFSLYVPTGWGEDNEYGQRLIAEDEDPLDPVVTWQLELFIGNRVGSAFYPNIFVQSTPVPSALQLHELVGEQIEYDREYSPGSRVVDHQLLEVGNHDAERLVVYLPEDSDGPEGYRLVLVAVDRGRAWALTCFVENYPSEESALCEAIFKSFQLD